MIVTLNVKRYDPEKSKDNTWYQEYKMDIHQSSTVLDALIHVREEIDGTLGLRCACRASICGSCGMRVNGQAKLVCKTRVEELSPDGETLLVEPMGNQPVIKDLVVDISSFFAKMEQVTPFLQPDKLPESGEFIASNDSMEKLLTEMNCIMCGLCVSDCTVLEVDNTFIGPAALAKASRFVYDPRDDKTSERLNYLNDESGGIWDCTRCMQCVEVCPKGVSPMELLLMGVAGCSSIDIISILKKQKQEFKNLYIEVEGKREDGELPSLFTQIHADVFIEGDVDSKKAYKASELSFTKYCSVSKTLEATADISFSVYVNNKICSK